MCELLMRRLKSHGAILDHEAEMVERDSNDKNWDIVSDGAGLKQVDGEVEGVVVLIGVQILRKNQLVHLPHLRIQHSTILVFLHCATILLLPDVEQNFADQEATAENSREIIGEICRVVLFGADPILNEAGCLHEGTACVEGLHKF